MIPDVIADLKTEELKVEHINYDVVVDLPGIFIGGGGGHTIQEEGTSLIARTGLNFIGLGVTAEDDPINDRTNVMISGTASPTSVVPYLKFTQAGVNVPASAYTDLGAVSEQSSQGTTWTVNPTNGDVVIPFAGIYQIAGYMEWAEDPTGGRAYMGLWDSIGNVPIDFYGEFSSSTVGLQRLYNNTIKLAAGARIRQRVYSTVAVPITKSTFTIAMIPDATVIGGGGGLDEAAADARYVNVDGDTMTGPLMFGTTSIKEEPAGTLALEAGPGSTVEVRSDLDAITNHIGAGTISAYSVSAFTAPTAPEHLTTKAYVDSRPTGGGGPHPFLLMGA